MQDEKGNGDIACGNTGARSSKIGDPKDKESARETVQRQRHDADLERRVIELTRQLEAANRTLEEFCYSISHGLRAPLMVMSGFSQVLMEVFADRMDGDALEYLKQINIASQRMSQMIGGLVELSVSVCGELHRTTLNLSKMARRISVELYGADPERRVEWDIEAGLRAFGDNRMIEVLLRNLLENAWKFTAGKADAKIRFYAERIGGKLFYCVADNGAGLDMACAEILFQPFQQLHPQDDLPGIGIGLATAQRIVYRHGGVISADGKPDHGATFRFTLPFDEEK